MIKKGILLLTIFVFSVTITMAQTKAITYKSHSGNPAFFDATGEGNLGLIEPFPMLTQIVKINDTTVVFYYNYSNGRYSSDSSYNDSNWLKSNIDVDSLHQIYWQIPLIGFTKQEADSIKTVQKTLIKNQKKANRKKKSEFTPFANPSSPNNSPLLRLFLLIGGIVCVMGIVFFGIKKRTIA